MSLLHINPDLLTADDVQDYLPLLTDRQKEILFRVGIGSTYVAIARSFGISQWLVREELRRARASIYHGKQSYPYPKNLRRIPVEAPIEVLGLPYRTRNILRRENGLNYVRDLFVERIISNPLVALVNIGRSRLEQIYRGLLRVDLPMLASKKAKLLTKFLTGNHNCSLREKILLETVYFGSYEPEQVARHVKVAGPGQIEHIIKKAKKTLQGSNRSF